ncbi:hypothetical protein G6F65_021722 [Rhizopus arrhizus]|nr:hypothetical protein G6F65_021722 [Rhizopus arrhizus]
MRSDSAASAEPGAPVLTGVPAAFDHPHDRAEFPHAAHQPGVELYRAHIVRHAFEPHDGKGMPQGVAGDAIPGVVFYVNAASDLEILSRAHGRDSAMDYLRTQAGAKYPAAAPNGRWPTPRSTRPPPT